MKTRVLTTGSLRIGGRLIAVLSYCQGPGFIRALKGTAVYLLLVIFVFSAGCVSKHKAQDQARAAFFAGQQQAVMQALQKELHGPTVTVLGEVRNAQVRWTADLTLAKAVVAAEYYGKTDPTEIVIQREGQEIRYDPKKLLGGEDVQLQPNDVIELAH
jgi:hypothetical protein